MYTTNFKLHQKRNKIPEYTKYTMAKTYKISAKHTTIAKYPIK